MTLAAIRTLFLALLFSNASFAGVNDMKVSAVQFPIDGAQSEAAFFNKVEHYLADAKAAGSSLVIFPELLILDLLHSGPGTNEEKQLLAISKDFTPRYFQWIEAKAKETGMMILGGSSPRFTQEGVVNTAIFAFPDENKEPIYQDKLNMTPDEKEWHWKNGTVLNVFDTPFGKTVMLICYDSQFASVSTQLRGINPDLFLVPSMTGKKGLNRVRWAAQARSVEHYATVIVTGTVDPKNPEGGDHVGQAVMIPPQDDALHLPNLISEGPFNRPALVTGSIDVDLILAAKKKAGLFSSRDDLQRNTSVVVNAQCNLLLK